MIRGPAYTEEERKRKAVLARAMIADGSSRAAVLKRLKIGDRSLRVMLGEEIPPRKQQHRQSKVDPARLPPMGKVCVGERLTHHFAGKPKCVYCGEGKKSHE